MKKETVKKAFRRTYNVLRTIIVTLLVTVVVLFAGLYIALSIPAVQDYIREVGEEELSDLLHTKVSIGKVSIEPFNEVVLQDVQVPDQKGDSLFTIDKVGAGLSLYNLIKDQRLVFTYAEVVGLKARITKPDKDSPTNMQFIIDAFKPKDNKPPKKFDLKIYNVVLRKVDASYDLLSAPRKPQDQFDANHLHVTDLKADIVLPRLKNDDFLINVKRLSLKEKSGFVLQNLVTNVEVTGKMAAARDLVVELPNSVLSLGDVELHYNSLKTMAQDIKEAPIDISISNSYVNLKDLGAFVPKLKDFDKKVNITAAVSGNMKDVNVRTLSINTDGNQLILNTTASVHHLDSIKGLEFDVPHLQLHAQAGEIESLISRFAALKPDVEGIVKRCGNIQVDASVSGNPHKINFNGGLATSLGNVDINGLFESKAATKSFAGHVSTPNFKLGTMLAKVKTLGDLALDVDLEAQLTGKNLDCSKVNGLISYVDFNGNRYHNIVADFNSANKDYTGTLSITDPNGVLNLNGIAHLDGTATTIDVDLVADDVNLSRLGLGKNIPDGKASLVMDANFVGNSLDNITGSVNVKDIDYSDVKGRKVHLKNISLNADNASVPQRIDLNSEFVNGNVTGTYDFKTLVPSIKGMLATAFPEFFGKYADELKNHGKKNDLKFNFVLQPNDEFNEMVKLPVKFVYKTTIDGNIDETDRSMALNVVVPYLQMGNKIIEGTDLSARLNGEAGNVTLLAHSIVPLKDSKAAVTINANGINNRLDTDVAWRVNRATDYHGNLNFSTLLGRNADGKLLANIDINPTTLVFNEVPWQVDPGKVVVNNGLITVNNLCGHCEGGQYLKINGEVSKSPESELSVELNDISLDNVFDALDVPNVKFGGNATGTFFAYDLLTKSPRMYTPSLHVDGIKYNGAVMGDADIKSRWLNDEKAVELDADIVQPNGRHSLINGAIFVTRDSLFLSFDADHANVAFMKPYMAAFTSDVQGEVSGKADLFGNFKTINLAGDIKADSLKFKLDFTNVYYTCSGDSVHMTPNNINFSDVRIHDRVGHEGKLNGWIKHNSFHDPVFNFAITDAHDLLCFDTNETINPNWYGQIFGNGSAFVTGEPGVVDIKVNMQSARNSKFTFVLSDSEEASEYNFITFRDRNAPVVEEVVEEIDTVPEIVKQMLKKQIKKQGPPTRYNIDLQGDITPDLLLILVMDPVGGDRIKARGSGNMRLTYNNDDEMTMFGKYVLDKGDYNFTLQDIIIKDFTIKNGSTISFQGDPYAAILDIQAVYSLNANIKDLDETFANDKEINRTNVPVHALLNVKGAISQPTISFDLEFPTLSTDAYRRVKSIISTDEMMNRQIIYLLALNRFYTPDYMNNTRANNELASVASSTISSQLSSMLGKMSENWSISPNFRSDRGDFSDFEMDLALSSQLLNNRLLFNGNFGYRDNTYNTRNSNFIGDFDIEYLLNKKGTFRLKAYNHFNDQNYYVRNALTTQGVGLVLKHDFDRPFDFLKRKPLKLKLTNDTTKCDTIVPQVQ